MQGPDGLRLYGTIGLVSASLSDLIYRRSNYFSAEVTPNCGCDPTGFVGHRVNSTFGI